MRALKKTIYTLCVNDYAPEIQGLTMPLMKAFAHKIGAEFHVISERKFPDWPVTYEKLQIYQLGREHGNDWNIFFDADTLISPEMFDPTTHLAKDTVAHNGRDMAGIRWTYDYPFLRDGRHVGSCNWCTIGSDWCLDLWHPLEDLTLSEAMKNIHVTIGEHNSGHCKTDHLIDDYTVSRNIARYGLKFTTITDICKGLGWVQPNGHGTSPFLWHKYTISNTQKVREMLAILSTPNGQLAFTDFGEFTRSGDGAPIMKLANGQIIGPCGMGWGIMTPEGAAAYRKKWDIPAPAQPQQYAVKRA